MAFIAQKQGLATLTLSMSGAVLVVMPQGFYLRGL